MAKGKWSKVPRMTAKQQAFVREFLEHQKRHFQAALCSILPSGDTDADRLYTSGVLAYNRNAISATDYMIAQTTARQPWLLTLTKGEDV